MQIEFVSESNAVEVKKLGSGECFCFEDEH